MIPNGSCIAPGDPGSLKDPRYDRMHEGIRPARLVDDDVRHL